MCTHKWLFHVNIFFTIETNEKHAWKIIARKNEVRFLTRDSWRNCVFHFHFVRAFFELLEEQELLSMLWVAESVKDWVSIEPADWCCLVEVNLQFISNFNKFFGQWHTFEVIFLCHLPKHEISRFTSWFSLP